MARLLFSAALLLGACSSSASPEQVRLMDQVEGRVQLPAGARPLTDYARYYAADGSGRVVAIYTLFVAPSLDDHDLPTGQRRWVADYGHLPNVTGGGCDTVHVVFTPATGAFEDSACNGRGGLPVEGS
jgi:hypothetical protein